jgi:hypothetical protein
MTSPSPSQSLATAAGLRLELSTDGETAVLTLHNIGASGLEVASHVDAGEQHLDWYTLRLDRPGATAATRTLRVFASRHESTLVKATLAPGATLVHRVDLQAWARRSVNGTAPIASGSYQLTADYEVTDEPGVWHGKLSAGPVAITFR